ncbi:MAG: two-component regulator propeller domain-containing protein [Bacteroidota bacterium]
MLYNLEQKTFKNYTYEHNNPQSVTGNIIHSIYFDTLGHVWIGSWDKGLVRGIEKNDSYVFKQVYSEKLVFSIQQDLEGYIWFTAYSKGIIRLDPDNMKYDLHTPNGKKGLKALYIDRDRNIWSGGDKAFLYVLTLKIKRLHK